jgi:hypothetical protein
MSYFRLWASMAAMVAFGGACGSPPSAAPAPPSLPCAHPEGLDPEACLLPWPSSAFLVADPTTRTGFRVSIGADATPQTQTTGQNVDPTPWNGWDGFSPMTSLLAEFASVVDPTPLPTWHDPGASLDPGSPTVLVDVDTGQRIAHFAEVETSPDVAAGHTELYIRPAARLAEGHHYAVGIRGLENTDGSAVAVSAPFAALRDNSSFSLAIDARRTSFETDVFAPLVAAGVEREGLLLAWDFRTASGQTAWGDLLAMRDLAIAAAGPNGLGCTVTTVTEDPTDPEIFSQISGTFTVPNFLTTTADGHTVIARDASGNPIAQGTTEASFLVMVPRTALAKATATGGSPPPLYVYGHGLFSDLTEITRDFGRDTLSKAGAVGAATEFLGFTNADEASVMLAFQDVDGFPDVVAKGRQGIIDTLLLPRTITGACASLPAFSSQGAPLVASSAGYGYFGNSMGGSLGATVAGLSPDIDRYALGVCAMDLSVMMPRAYGWDAIELFFKQGYPARIDRDLLVVMSAEEWDLVEDSPFAPHLLQDPLPGSQVAHLLFQIGLYDSSSTNVASEIAGRTLGLPELSPTAHAVWGLPPQTAPLDSGYVVYDLGATPLPEGTQAPGVDNAVHEGVRRDPRAQAQLVAFLQAGGAVTDTCDGACSPLQ